MATTLKKSDRFEIHGVMYRIGAVATITTTTFGTVKHLRLVEVTIEATGQSMVISLSRVLQMIEDGSMIRHPKVLA